MDAERQRWRHLERRFVIAGLFGLALACWAAGYLATTHDLVENGLALGLLASCLWIAIALVLLFTRYDLPAPPMNPGSPGAWTPPPPRTPEERARRSARLRGEKRVVLPLLAATGLLAPVVGVLLARGGATSALPAGLVVAAVAAVLGYELAVTRYDDFDLD